MVSRDDCGYCLLSYLRRPDDREAGELWKYCYASCHTGSVPIVRGSTAYAWGCTGRLGALAVDGPERPKRAFLRPARTWKPGTRAVLFA